MKTEKRFALLLFFLFPILHLSAGHRISGFIKDGNTGEFLIGASIIEKGTNNGTSTDNNGYFSLVSKTNFIRISYIGYKNQELYLDKDTLINILLEGGKEIGEVYITSRQNKKFNVSRLTKSEMLSIPSLGGKPDILKALQLMPGIQSQQEGSSLLNIRGGNPGENLYLFDNVPIIYVNHLGGFMSVFNPEMINNIEVYKGGFPPRYGGKLSSVISITQREGDKSKLKGSLSIGVTDASFSVEGPLLNKKASFIITGRKTLIDPFMILISGIIEGNNNYVFYGFHDFNGKFSWHPDTKNSIYFNFYQGDDYLQFWNKKNLNPAEKFKLSNTWGNYMASLRWKRVHNLKLFSDNSISYTRYRLKTIQSFSSVNQSDTISYQNDFFSSVQDFSIMSDWQYNILKNWSLDFGVKSSLLINIPNKILNSETDVSQNFERIIANESSIYFNNRLSLFGFLDINAGMRLVNYTSDNYYKFSAEPRLSVNAKVLGNNYLNFSYQKVTQFAHLIYTSGSILNNEIWIPANSDIEPSYSTQYSVGWKYDIDNGNFQSEIDLYYKNLNNLATYKEGYSNLVGDGNWRSKIETGGIGISKGFELLLRKNKGDWKGFVSYSFSNSTRKYSGINSGKEFLYDFDRPHSFSVNVNRKINDKWSFNILWVYQSGNPYTPVIGRQLTLINDLNGNPGQVFTEELIYGEKNSARMKDYHRLDISATLNVKTKKGRRAEWNFSVYNLYNRKNPTSYYYGYDKEGAITYSNSEKYTPIGQYQISFFPIIPSVSYKIYFE